MSTVKKLASDTAAYGVSSILARLINFLFGFLIIKYISQAEFGTFTNFYAYAGFILVLLTHGMETAFFRFVNKEESKEKAFSTAFYSILSVVLLFVAVGYVFQQPIADYVKEPTLYVKFFIWMMAFDTLAAIPFASLRKQGKPVAFAVLKVMNILLFIVLNILFFMVLPSIGYQLPFTKVSSIFIANIIASIITFLFLLKQFNQLEFSLDAALYKQMLKYSMPIMLVGFAGMINEVLDRIIMTRLLPYDDITNKEQLGIYGFNYKFAMLVAMFLQAYRFAAEPLFFRHAEKSDSKSILASTMKYYTICVCIIFLSIVLFLPLIQYVFILYSPKSAAYFVGADIIPILLMANIFLGIYFNISTWYKITDKTYIGALIAVVGAVITIVMNVILVPKFGYFGAAWATLACYTTMVILGYITEQKYYPIPYDYKRILFYLFFAVVLFVVLKYVILPMQFSLLVNTIFAFVLLSFYVFSAYFLEKKK
ncbi:MAG TPA: polysaccharide biosynthesis C-terminal domain-containing protein [Chitinophagales bacterium]|nr:polysaccharide biosynthesis C-terminal domain-containing protein [Chitinophagales bacterium]